MTILPPGGHYNPRVASTPVPACFELGGHIQRHDFVLMHVFCIPQRHNVTRFPNIPQSDPSRVIPPYNVQAPGHRADSRHRPAPGPELRGRATESRLIRVPQLNAPVTGDGEQRAGLRHKHDVHTATCHTLLHPIG